MTKDEYLHVLATEPATSKQVGAILGEFARLGVDDRAERLAISAELLGLGELGSTAGLVMGDAGRLYRMLLDVRDRAELPDVTAVDIGDQADKPDGDDLADDEHQADEHGNVERITWPEAITRIMVMLYAAIWGRESTGKPAEYSAACIGLTSREGRQIGRDITRPCADRPVNTYGKADRG